MSDPTQSAELVVLLQQVLTSPTQFKGSRSRGDRVFPYEAKRLDVELLDRIRAALNDGGDDRG